MRTVHSGDQRKDSYYFAGARSCSHFYRDIKRTGKFEKICRFVILVFKKLKTAN